MKDTTDSIIPEKVDWGRAYTSLRAFCRTLENAARSPVTPFETGDVTPEEEGSDMKRHEIRTCVLGLPCGLLTIHSLNIFHNDGNLARLENAHFSLLARGTEIQFKCTDLSSWSIQLDGTDLFDDDRNVFAPQLQEVLSTLNDEFTTKLNNDARLKKAADDAVAAERTAGLRRKFENLLGEK